MTQRIYIAGGVAYVPQTELPWEVIDLDVIESEGACPLCGADQGVYQLNDFVCIECGIDWSMPINDLEKEIDEYQGGESS